MTKFGFKKLVKALIRNTSKEFQPRELFAEKTIGQLVQGGGVKRRPKNCPNKVIYLRIDGRPFKISALILRPAPIVESANSPLAINFAKF